jgi:thymidylate synthase (FAD)
MKYVKPTVYMLADTGTHFDNVDLMLAEAFGIEKGNWDTDCDGDAELLVEVAGRLCYRSFAPGLNANVTKVREGNREYIRNLLAQHHGSVLEHGSVSFALIRVSRILTHELVRHRPGAAYSQESGRYVRLDEFEMYQPDAFYDILDEDEAAKVHRVLKEAVEHTEWALKEAMTCVDWDSLDFKEKKRLTSAFRRYAPAGTTTNIIVTMNHRAWRHVIEARTSEGAEEEIVPVIDEVAKQLLKKFPNIYQDMTQQGTIIDPGPRKFTHSKV